MIKNIHIPVIYKISKLYQTVYSFGEKIPKRDRYGIWQRVEELIIEILELAIAAAFEEKQNKKPFLKSARIKVEIIKNLIRNCSETKIIEDKKYLNISEKLIIISKEITSWINYLS